MRCGRPSSSFCCLPFSASRLRPLLVVNTVVVAAGGAVATAVRALMSWRFCRLCQWSALSSKKFREWERGDARVWFGEKYARSGGKPGALSRACSDFGFISTPTYLSHHGFIDIRIRRIGYRKRSYLVKYSTSNIKVTRILLQRAQFSFLDYLSTFGRDPLEDATNGFTSSGHDEI